MRWCSSRRRSAREVARLAAVPIFSARSARAAIEMAGSVDGWKTRRIVPAVATRPARGRSTIAASTSGRWSRAGRAAETGVSSRIVWAHCMPMLSPRSSGRRTSSGWPPGPPTRIWPASAPVCSRTRSRVVASMVPEVGVALESRGHGVRRREVLVGPDQALLGAVEDGEESQAEDDRSAAQEERGEDVGRIGGDGRLDRPTSGRSRRPR